MHVYFIQNGDDGPIKIGVTSDVPKRFSELQVASATPLRLLAFVDHGDHEHAARAELELHARFWQHRIRGEWFQPAAELLELIAAAGPPKVALPRPVGRPARAGEAADRRLSVRVTEAEAEAWESAAGDAELSLGEWIRERCNRAAARSA